ncbi:flagellar assembly peptidoglycan hydrolase FlgJ [Eleftheria terrae]|uniref:flagellar assembly peptidoglycan hydrolase FlgJ n=1 Tax=Eleftheria terrae TaxID=1597781 RepID=UPI00263A6E7A|nr:flagellar assembly peptidoglycan hydrolase FlgJ [Eleftheria terrae]WKB54466.1 flagellar assembly peptidoglycan hydrolase FlgJ [Eleftheria terrae]
MTLGSPRLPAQGLASDSRSLDALRTTSAKDPKAAIKEAAKQFEAVFMQQLMKTMRDSTMKSGMLDNEGSDMGTEMLDQQYATQMSGLSGGLADVIARQLSRNLGGTEATTSAEVAQQRLPKPLQGLPKSVAIPKASGSQGDFLRENWDAAQVASQETGIPAEFVLAQAAHESGWGKRDIRNADGSSSHNLFGIKAGSSWKGKVAEVTTTEYIGGQPRKVVAKFRSYDSAEDAFRDYARLLKNNDRYAEVVRQGGSAQGFAQGLQKAGYATDPAYADKLTRIINTTLRLQRAAT